ncbi:Pectinesterase inhibitor domain containing protein [Melia azedarach]|uniref:Pectinesterase inhibitor domain containing protein n=1 Tax=Melia azedarach TaxID=155640 RepID=A0ACC1WPX8_MELAZ|nr:Pectinesterase inhibitor domain containing protein [Melia azedarach]
MDSHNIFIKQVAPAAVASIAAFLLLLQFPSQTNAITLNSPSNLVDGICRKTLNYADCVSALQLDSLTLSTSDLNALARIALEIAVANTTNSKAFIQELAESKSTKPSLKRALKLCVWAYEGSVASFNSAKSELDEDISSANYDAKVAGDGAVTCETVLNSTEADEPTEIKARNYFLSLYSNIGSVITDKLGG